MIATGSKPLAITDNLNFGNPEKKEIMYQIKEAILGIKEACEKLSYPVVSGNVSLYNETKGKSILPTPVIGGIGLIKDLSQAIGLKIDKGDHLYIVGKTLGHLDLSVHNQICDDNSGSPPEINFEDEIKNGNFIYNFIKKFRDHITGCHDVSEGGAITSIAEICIKNKLGVIINIPKNIKQRNWLFSEEPSRFIVSIKNDKDFLRIAKKNKVFVEKIGEVSGKNFKIINELEIPLKKLINYNKTWFHDYLRIDNDIKTK